MHPEYPNDNIQSLLRPGDSLVRRQFGFISSWDQSLFYQPCTPRGSYTKLPCSQCVKHIVRQWLFVNLVVVLWGWESLWVYGAAQQSRRNKGLFWTPKVVCWDWFISGAGGVLSLETLPFPRSESVCHRDTEGTGETRCQAAAALDLLAKLLGRDEGQKDSLCVANAGASNNGSLAFQENYFSTFTGLLTWLLWVLRNCPRESAGQMQYLNAFKVES